MIALRVQNNNFKEAKFVIIVKKNLLVMRVFFWIIAGAGAENVIFFSAPAPAKYYGSATLI